MKKIGFVAPWYGEKIGGGAEAELRGLVYHLAEAGAALEVLTTCAESFRSDWSVDFHEPGLTEEAGIPVRRFRVRKRNMALFDPVNRKLMKGLRITREEEEIYCRETVNSPELYAYMKEHGEEYSLFVFIPYMFGTTYYGCQIRPEKSILIPCLHDESYAYLSLFQEAYSKVAGMVFNAEPERLLAEKLYGVKGENFVTFGLGMDTGWTADAERFREKTGIRSPFILYAGRKEAGKQVDVLVRYFTRFRQEWGQELKLVLIGGGEIANPDPENILDLGFVEEQVKQDTYAAAAFFCNPSGMESFSIVMMESWLAGRPVLVNGKCAVMKDFAVRANAGLYYENYGEFAGCARYLMEHGEEAAVLGKNGRAFVKENFAWEAIVEKYITYFERVCK